MSRLEGNDINNRTNDPEDMMLEIMQILRGTVTPVPDVGNFYTFVYNPKTPNIPYDVHPLVAVFDVFDWGFRGLNYHWGEVRNYTFPEVVGGLYKVTALELRSLRTIPFARIRLNS